MSFQKDTLTVAGLKKLTHDLKQAIHSVTGLEVPLHQVQEIAARQLGEASWHDAYAQAKRVRPNAKPKTETASPEWVIWARMNLKKRAAEWRWKFLDEPKENLMRALEQGASAQFQVLLVEFDAGVQSLLETARPLSPQMAISIQRARNLVLIHLMEGSIDAPEGGPVFAEMWDRLQDSLTMDERRRIVRHAIENPLTFDHLIKREVRDLEDFDDEAFLEWAFNGVQFGKDGNEKGWAILERIYALYSDPDKAQDLVLMFLDDRIENTAQALHRLIPEQERTVLLTKMASSLEPQEKYHLKKAQDLAKRLDVEKLHLSLDEGTPVRAKRLRRTR